MLLHKQGTAVHYANAIKVSARLQLEQNSINSVGSVEVGLNPRSDGEIRGCRALDRPGFAT
jgi:hypothetical protein